MSIGADLIGAAFSVTVGGTALPIAPNDQETAGGYAPP